MEVFVDKKVKLKYTYECVVEVPIESYEEKLRNDLNEIKKIEIANALEFLDLLLESDNLKDTINITVDVDFKNS